MQKAAKPVDVQVGARVRVRRRMLGLTQGDLAAALGVTFQQVQKYEKGTNRIGAGRLQDIANILGVPVATFFEDEPAHAAERAGSGADFTKFASSEEGLALARSFARIGNAKVRRRVVRLVEELSNAADNSGAGWFAFDGVAVTGAGTSGNDHA